jgi:hypothetical protein
MESCNGAKFEVFWELEYHKQMTFTVRPFWNEKMIKQHEKIEEALAVAEAAAAVR